MRRGRVRTRTEMIGCLTTPEERQALEDYVKARGCSIADYLREIAVAPLLVAKLASREVVEDASKN